jgi:catechol 2,3-dioxygenase-like lactoylglutathione lyase family enzyme
MFARIRHVAVYTENHHRMADFYKTVFGMRKITTGMTDEKGNYDSTRGHISDGVIGLALLQRHAGTRPGLDHFGFEVQDIETVRERLRRKYPQVRIAKSLEHVPFAVTRIVDPAGTHIDVSHKGAAKVREGYLEEGWDQPRHLHHLAISAANPTLLADFYEEIFGLTRLETAPNFDCLSDGKVSLLIRPCENTSYRSMTEGLEHIGFEVESLEQARSDIDAFEKSFPDGAPRKLELGRYGKSTQEELEACPLGRHAMADPDGVLLDLFE